MSYELGKILIKQKKYKRAFYIFSKFLKTKPNELKANFHIGKIYYELNNLEKSIIFFNKCNKIQPNNSNILFNLALSLQSTGQIEEAKKYYLNIIKMNPNDIRSYYALSILNINNINSEIYNNLKLIVKNNKISIFEKSLINFIFSKIEKKKNQLKEEINYLKIAHQYSFEANIDYNKKSNFYYKKIISNNFNKFIFKGKFEINAEFNNSKHIFIVGLPRSGSSLVETIISHNEPNINSLGEFHGINSSILDQIGKTILSKNFDYKNTKLIIDKKKFQEDILEKYDNFKNKLYLDKSLENFFNIEVILQFFPNAKFIHTYRNFNDAVIGIYMTMLPKLSWSHTIDDIISYINLYKKTIKFFREKYPEKIIDVELSKLTNNKEEETKKILNFCNIELNNNFLNFDTNKNLANKTNSFLQVRKKITVYEDEKYKPYYNLLNENIN
jgi:tetratricopeptide (TPR) repeat protein